MNMVSRSLSIILSLGLLSIIFELVRRRKLKEKYAILWIITGVIILIMAIFQNLLIWFTHLFGIITPINALFFFGIFFIIIINLHFSLVISNLSEQIRKVAQRLVLLEGEIKIFKNWKS